MYGGDAIGNDQKNQRSGVTLIGMIDQMLEVFATTCTGGVGPCGESVVEEHAHGFDLGPKLVSLVERPEKIKA